MNCGQQVVLAGRMLTAAACICSPEACYQMTHTTVSQQMHQFMGITCHLPHGVCGDLLVM